ncbi:regulator of nonsense transcripts 2-like [Schistocerca serialis cubense]|uniref:regulator of nonsense transcripts 2-like n=1 Tax=Schistocerca serialis cubense TaxID=2023355 RepID=UPI00214F05AB|nr:regulator of nonsense transcripts 2-like [Schistocerca serialis cubense]XP_049955093.1 regulator of nonsense transcripts 2-like [Schistocerca serialis cubense]XP_049955094.1 regulator of nonsense transcripts 2-like [Schistocerca serialis cubense]XP_049955095.1 regulator of nonsense transcripts 2-like [Schistocerca serialis cubense]
MDPYEFARNKYYDTDYTYSGNQFCDHIDSAVANSMSHEHSSTPFLYRETGVDLANERVRENSGLGGVPLRQDFLGSCEGISDSFHSMYDVPTFSTHTMQDVCNAKDFRYDNNDAEDNSFYYAASDAVPNHAAYYLASANIMKECDPSYPVIYPPATVTDQCTNSVKLHSADSDSSQVGNYSQKYTPKYTFDPCDREFIEALVVKLAEKSVMYAESREKGKEYYDFAASTTEGKSVTLAQNGNLSAGLPSASSLDLDRSFNYDSIVSDREINSVSHDKKALVPSDETDASEKRLDIENVNNVDNSSSEQNVEDAIEEVPYGISVADSSTHQSTVEEGNSEAKPAIALSPEEAMKYFLETNCLNVTSYKILDSNWTVKEIEVTSDWFPETTLDIDDEQQRNLLTYVQQTHLRVLVKNELRKINYNLTNCRPDETFFSKLDSSLKKNTAFVRKLKTFTGSQLPSLLRDMSTLNLSKYVSEVAAALVDAKLKMVDVWPAVQLCSLMHQTYADFGPFLLDNWQKVLSLKKDEKIANQAKLRVDLRFYAELISVGIFTHKEGLPLLGNILTVLTNMDREEHHNINIILSFCRHCGDDYAGLVPRRLRILSERHGIAIPQYNLLSKEKQRNVKLLLKDYYSSLCKHRLKEHLELQNFVRQNRKILQTKGELSSERKEKLEALQASFERIDVGTQQFAEALDEDIPALPEDESLKHDIMAMNGSSENEEGAVPPDLWEDEETKRFYENFPDLKEFIPSLQVRAVEPEPVVSEEALDAEFEKDLNCISPEEETLPPEPEEIEETEPSAVSNKVLIESFLSALPNCVNQEMIDSAAIDFAMNLNTKHNRKKVVRALFNVPRIRLDLLPFYGRFVATLHPVQPDISEDLCQLLKQDFKYHIRKKDQMNIESKVKVVRFIGELVKFRMYSKIESLYCLKVLVQDFTHHHIEMCCNLLESCGRFLIRHHDCHQRMKVYLEQMMRKKAVMALDSRYVTMIENAYYFVNPPDSSLSSKKERPPEHEFIRKILYQDLTKTNIDKILRLMRKLDWNQADVASYAIKCLTYAFKVKYFNIRCLANLLAGLVAHQEFVGTYVVDGVLEDIRLGMEVNLPKYNQRRVAMIKYLGELYNYRMVESSNIFQVLYTLITFGVTWDWTVPSVLDPPDSLFRIRLVCVLLETCGQYFVSGMSKKKLDMFLVYFQHYYWFKYLHPVWTTEQPFPVGISHMVKETITNLRRNIHLFNSLEEAEEAVIKLRAEQEANLGPLQKFWQGSNNADDTTSQGSIGDNSVEFDDESEQGASDLDTSQEDLDADDGASSGISGLSELVIPGEDSYSVDSTYDLMCENIKDENYSEMLNTFDVGDTTTGRSDVHIQSEKTDGCLAPRLVECPEDDEFLNAFERMVSDNIQDRLQETIKPQQVDISVPLHIKGSSKKTYEQLQEEEQEKTNMNFVLMLRKGHKQQYKNLAVPVDSEMALNLKNREEAERAEKERVKRLTLDINERLEEEDYQEMLAQAQRPAFMNLNRERRHKYQHPKGAPDADLIFGPKKVR